MPVIIRLVSTVVFNRSGRKDLQEVAAALLRLGPGRAIDLRFLHVAPDVEHQQCRKNPGPEHCPPRQMFRQHRIQQQEKQVRYAPAHRPSALHRAHRLAAVLRADHFPDQHRADRPLAAESQALQRARDQQLLEGIREPAEKGEEGEPGNGQLKNAHAPESVRQHTRQPAADRRTDDRHGGDPAGLNFRHAPHRNQGGHDVGEDHDIDRVGGPPRDRGDQRLALPPVQLFQPCEHRSSFIVYRSGLMIPRPASTAGARWRGSRPPWCARARARAAAPPDGRGDHGCRLAS